MGHFLGIRSCLQGFGQANGNPELMSLTWEFLGREVNFSERALVHHVSSVTQALRGNASLHQFLFLEVEQGHVLMTDCMII